MGKFKDFKKKVAGAIVTYYYNRAYGKAVALADKRHRNEGETFYVIQHFVRGQLLSVINRKDFRLIKHSAQKLHKSEVYYSNKYNIDMLKQQCWYHTADRSGSNALPARDVEARRIAFIREGLKKARL